MSKNNSNSNGTIIISIIVAGILIAATFFLTKGGGATGQNNSNGTSGENVTVVDGKQIIEIRAKGGYLPRRSEAKADLPTTLRFITNGTFDCTSSVRIPSLDIARNLAPSGNTDIDLGSPQKGLLLGTCGMGMFPFEVSFN